MLRAVSLNVTMDASKRTFPAHWVGGQLGHIMDKIRSIWIQLAYPFKAEVEIRNSHNRGPGLGLGII